MKVPELDNTKFDEVVYLFQGGGALGAYQVGVFQALTENGYSPDWMVGISIGSINASIIAGNPPEHRLDKLIQFWNTITHSIEPFWSIIENERKEHNLLTAYNMTSAFYSLICGQKNFFLPVGVNPWLLSNLSPDKISYY